MRFDGDTWEEGMKQTERTYSKIILMSTQRELSEKEKIGEGSIQETSLALRGGGVGHP